MNPEVGQGLPQENFELPPVDGGVLTDAYGEPMAVVEETVAYQPNAAVSAEVAKQAYSQLGNKVNALGNEMVATTDNQKADELFTELYLAFTPTLSRLKVMGQFTPEQRDDILQAVFEKAWRARYRETASFKGGNIAAWLTRITKNHITDIWSREQKVRMASLESDEVQRSKAYKSAMERELRDSPEDTIAPGASGVLAPLEQNKAMAEPWKDVLWHVDVLGMGYEEYAALRGLSTGTVRSRLHRARTTLRENPDVQQLAKEHGYNVV